VKNILIIGQCSLHWGRMEFGNIGNFYIIEPFIRQLYENLGDINISTTMQMSNIFCDKENVNVLPIDLYYAWDNDLEKSLVELSSAEIFSKTGYLPKTTPYIEAVLKSDLVIDFSGDIWGDNANFLGKDRFLVGLMKDRVAQLLGKPTVMLAGSPGPFNDQETKKFAKEVFENFDLVTNRETISIDVLKNDGFDVSNVKSLACPAFLFEPASGKSVDELLEYEGLADKAKPVVGFVVCGWNFVEGPFDRDPRSDSEFIQFAAAVEYINNELGAKVCLMSHSNGFKVPPNIFELIHGRDYRIAKQLQKVIDDRGIAKDVFCLDGIYDAWTTKALISNFDMLVSGRIHGSVAGLSQMVPTVMIDYGHEPKAHKVRGFADVVGVNEYVADPSEGQDVINKICLCWNNKGEYRQYLERKIPLVKDVARDNFRSLNKLL